MKKYEIVVKQLKQEIDAGSFKAGDRFYTDVQLIDKFNVSNTTIEYAVKQMVKEGILERIKGKGTFVRSRGLICLSNLFALIMKNEGHIYQDLFIGIVDRLKAEKHFTYLFYPPIDVGNSFKSREENLKNLSPIVENDLAGLIIDGIEFLPFDYLAKCRNKDRMVFVHRYESDRLLDASYVLSDYWQGGHDAAKYLVDKGHTRIAVLVYPRLVHHKSIYQLLNGFQTACEESGLRVGYDIRAVFNLEGQQEDIAATLTTGKWAPTALFSVADFPIFQLMPYLKKAGVRIPEDMALMGYWDTPWATSLEVPLTSVNLQLDIMADKACDIASRIATGETVREKHIIIPKLVERASTLS